MKKTLLKTLAVLPLSLTASLPLVGITSCSKTGVYDQLEKDTINEFKALAQFPHSSDLFLYQVPGRSNCLAISTYLKNRVKELTGVEPTQDIYSNLWFDLPANDNKYKDAPTIALQAHMDMVFTYDESKYEKGQEPDPVKTPIELVEDVVDGKRVIHSKDYKTSIGGDNGIGVATILALIQNKNVKHGNLRVIFTNCEENAMQGAMMMVDGYEDKAREIQLQPTKRDIMEGIKYVLNLDAGIGKEICISCSGGVGSHYSNEYDSWAPPSTNHFKLTAKGFTGGHSGGVPRQNLGNPIKAVNEVLEYLIDEQANNIQLINYQTPGVLAYNAVGKEAEVEFMSTAKLEDVQRAINLMVKNHSDPADEDYEGYWSDLNKDYIQVTQITTSNPEHVVKDEDSKKIIKLHQNLLYGYDKQDAKKGIKTSSNIGPTELTYNKDTGKFDFKTSSYSRSDSEDQIKAFKQSNKDVAEEVGFDYLCDAQFHPWTKDKNTKWLDLAKQASAHALDCNKDEITEYEAHAGFECSWWSYALKEVEKIEDGGCICLGVNVTDEHSYKESVQVDSIKDCMEAVIYMFENSINMN